MTCRALGRLISCSAKSILAITIIIWPVSSHAANGDAYISNSGSNNVSVISPATNTVTRTIAVGTDPQGVAVTPDGRKVYVGNENSGTVSVIDSATDTVTATVTVGTRPVGIAITPDGARA